LHLDRKQITFVDKSCSHPKIFFVPEIFRKLGFVFFFYSNEGQEPMHVHVRKAGGFAKFWVEPVDLDFSQGMKISDIKKAEELIFEHIDLIKQKWYEVHDS